jgi:hypothetical protein
MVLVLLFLGDVGVMADIAPYQPSPAKTIASNIAETSSARKHVFSEHTTVILTIAAQDSMLTQRLLAA